MTSQPKSSKSSKSTKSTSSQSSKRRNRPKKGVRMNKGLAAKLDAFQKDNIIRQQQHNAHQTWARPTNVNKMQAEDLDERFRGRKYETQLNDVSQLEQQRYADATAFREFEHQERAVGRMNDSDFAQYEEQQPDQEDLDIQFRSLSKARQMEELIKSQILKVIGNNRWSKSNIKAWMQRILLKIEQILDEYLQNAGVYKYCIDVIIMKTTAIARQSEMLKSPTTDYSFNMKIKNANGLTVIINTHAFRVA